MSDQVLAKRLKDLRLSLGFKLNEAAEKLGFPFYQTLTQIEEGKREVKASELQQFSKVYFQSIPELLGLQAPFQYSNFVWRNPPEEVEKKQVEAELIDYAKKYHKLEHLLGMATKWRKFKIRVDHDDVRTQKNITELADSFRVHLSLGNRPASVLPNVLEQNHGVKILFHRLSDIGSGASNVHPEFGAIAVINADEVPWRRNYDLAHELFHLLTWEIFPPEDLKDPTYLKEIDKKADSFASVLLLPEGEVRKSIDDHKDAKGKISFPDLIDIALEFDVSTQALIYRIYNLGYITWEKAQELIGDDELLSINRERRRAARGTIPRSRRFDTLAIRCLSKGLISRGKFAEITKIDRCDIDQFVEDYGLIEIEGKPFEIMDNRC